MPQLARPATCNLCTIGWLQIHLSQAERMQIPPPGQETKNKSVSRGPARTMPHHVWLPFFLSLLMGTSSHTRKPITTILAWAELGLVPRYEPGSRGCKPITPLLCLFQKNKGGRCGCYRRKGAVLLLHIKLNSSGMRFTVTRCRFLSLLYWSTSFFL
jgi:hypothetical protein